MVELTAHTVCSGKKRSTRLAAANDDQRIIRATDLHHFVNQNSHLVRQNLAYAVYRCNLLEDASATELAKYFMFEEVEGFRPEIAAFDLKGYALSRGGDDVIAMPVVEKKIDPLHGLYISAQLPWTLQLALLQQMVGRVQHMLTYQYQIDTAALSVLKQNFADMVYGRFCASLIAQHRLSAEAIARHVCQEVGVSEGLLLQLLLLQKPALAHAMMGARLGLPYVHGYSYQGQKDQMVRLSSLLVEWRILSAEASEVVVAALESYASAKARTEISGLPFAIPLSEEVGMRCDLCWEDLPETMADLLNQDPFPYFENKQPEARLYSLKK